jgi:hypothetical protein
MICHFALAIRAQDQQTRRRAIQAMPARDMTDQIERGWVGPLEIIDQQQQPALVADRGQEIA